MPSQVTPTSRELSRPTTIPPPEVRWVRRRSNDAPSCRSANVTRILDKIREALTLKFQPHLDQSGLTVLCFHFGSRLFFRVLQRVEELILILWRNLRKHIDTGIVPCSLNCGPAELCCQSFNSFNLFVQFSSLNCQLNFGIREGWQTNLSLGRVMEQVLQPGCVRFRLRLCLQENDQGDSGT